jgi:hypothetical protein
VHRENTGWTACWRHWAGEARGQLQRVTGHGTLATPIPLGGSALIHTPIFGFDGDDCMVYRAVPEVESSLEPFAVADAELFGADGARLRLVLGPTTTIPARRRWWRPQWKGPAEVLVRESEEPLAPVELAERLRAYLAAIGASSDELAGLDLEALVERVTARS